MSGQLLTAEQLAACWQVPKSQVYRLTRKGAIPAVKLGRYYRYRLDPPERWEVGEFEPTPPTVKPADAISQSRSRPETGTTGASDPLSTPTSWFQSRAALRTLGRPTGPTGSCECGRPTSPTYVRCLPCHMETVG